MILLIIRDFIANKPLTILINLILVSLISANLAQAQSEVEIGPIVPITGLQNQLILLSVNKQNRVQKSKTQGLLGVLSNSLRSKATPSQMQSAVSNYGEDFDDLVSLSQGDLGNTESSLDALVEPLTLIPVFGPTVGKVIKPIARQGTEELIFGDLKAEAKLLTAGANPFVLSNQVSDLVQEIGQASPARRQQACRILGNLIEATPCPDNPQELVSQVDANGGNASIAQQLLEAEQRLRDNSLSPAEARELVNGLKTDLTNELNKTNGFIKNGITELTEVVNDAATESERRDKEIIEGLGEVDKKLDRVVTYIDKQEEAAKKAEEKAERKAELDEIHATGQLFATVIGIADPELGKQTKAVVNFAITVNKVFNNIDEIGTAALTGNLVGAALGVFSAFSDTGPTPDELILDQLSLIREDLSEIKQQLVKIDTKLDNILSTIDAGFEQIQNGIDVIIADIAKNTSLTLDNQFLILNQSEILVETLSDQAYGTCLTLAINNADITDQEFRNCAALLQNYATNLMFVQEEGLPPGFTAETLQNILFGPSISRSTAALRQLYSDKESVAFTGDIASYEKWFIAFEYMRTFLTAYPLKTVELFDEDSIGISRLQTSLQQLRDFRLRVLDEFETIESGENITSTLESSHKAFVAEIDRQISSSISEYNRSNTHGLKIREDIGLSWDEIDAYDTVSESCIGLTSDVTNITAVASVNFQPSPSSNLQLGGQLRIKTDNAEVCKALKSGSVKLFATLQYIESDYDRVVCRVSTGINQFLYSSRNCRLTNFITHYRYRITNDVWSLKLSLASNRGTASLWDSDDYIFTPVLDSANISVKQGGPKWIESSSNIKSFTEPKLCSTPSCISSAYLVDSDVLSFNFANNNQNSSVNIEEYVRLRHEELQKQLADNTIEMLLPDKNTTTSMLNNTILIETLYISALTRFAFAEYLSKYDALYEIGSHNIRYPDPNYVLSNMTFSEDVFRLDNYLSESLNNFINVLSSLETKEIIENAKDTIDLNVKDADLQLVKDYFTNVRSGGVFDDFYFNNTENIAGDVGSSGGGSSLSAQSLVVLVVFGLCLIVYRRRCRKSTCEYSP